MCWYKVGPLSDISYNPRETPVTKPQNSIYSDHRFGATPWEICVHDVFFGATFSPERFLQVFDKTTIEICRAEISLKNAEVTFTSSITTSIGSMQTTTITSSITTLTTSHIATTTASTATTTITTASTAVTATTFTMSCLDSKLWKPLQVPPVTAPWFATLQVPLVATFSAKYWFLPA